jgi:broad specificity phosphatase PhoE
VLVLVRHGQSEANVRGLISGRAESPLTEAGLAQAASLSASLAGAGRLVTSPLGRARQTAAALGLDLPVEVDDRWTEMDYGHYEGAAVAAVPPEVWRRWRADPDFRPPGGETMAEVSLRVGRACEELFATPDAGARAGADVIVVSHVSPIKAAVAWCLGAGEAAVWRLYLSTASITRVAWGAGGPVLYSFNETCGARS